MLQQITRALGMVCLLLTLLTAAPTTTSAQPPVEIRVNTTVDAPDANPGDGVCATATGQCSLRAAMQERIERVYVPAGTYHLTIPGTGEDNSATGDLDFGGRHLIGEGPDRTIIDGNGLDRVLSVYSEYNSGFVSGLTIIGGHTQNGEDGGGVLGGQLYSVIVRDNHADGNGGGVAHSALTASLVVGNSATNGGGAYQLSNISASTISSNTASNDGGGLYTSLSTNSNIFADRATIIGNIADSDNNGSGDGGGLYVTESTMQADFVTSIIADNTDSGGEAPDCGGAFSEIGDLNGSNIIGTLRGCSYRDTSFRSYIGINPRLTPLRDNGGPIPSHAPLSGSPAIDGGFSGLGGCLSFWSQQGFLTIETMPCDLGAYETGGDDIPRVTVIDPMIEFGKRVPRDYLERNSILVSYSTMMNAFDGTASFDIRNLNNYILVTDGGDNIFQTTQCNVPQGDDQSIALAYDWGEYYFYGLSNVQLAIPEQLHPLPNDRYRLIVCDTVQSYDGVRLDGNRDGIPGGNFIHEFVINEVPNMPTVGFWPTNRNTRGPLLEPMPLDILRKLEIEIDGGINTDDTSNYRLIGAGSDGRIQSSSCNAISPADLQITFSLEEENRNMVLRFDSQPPGLYRVMACDTIVGSTGIRLDGDNDGNPGGDYIVDLRVKDTPPLINPGTQVHQVGEETWLQIRTGYNNWPRVYNYYTPAITGQATGLPPGLTVDTTTGLISGTPTTEGQFRTTISIPEWNVSETFDWLVVTTPSNLTAEGDLNAAPVKPKLTWTYNSTQATYYHVYVQNSHGQAAVDQWFPAAEVCTGEVCTVTPTLPDHGLLNGEHQWWIGAYLANYDLTVYSGGGTYVPATFTVDVPSALKPADFAVDGNHGRPLLTWTHDPNSLWFQVYGGGAAMTDLRWHNANDLCTEGVCTLPMDFVTGTYDFWMQAWGPGGFSSVSGADGAASWLQALNAPLTLTPFNAGLPTDLTINTDGAVTWTSGANATWYEVYVTTDDYAGVWALGWHAAMDIGCAAPSTTCTLSGQFDGELVSGQTYKIYIRAWGPGGFSDGGPFPSSPQWNEGTVTYSF